MKGVSNVKNQPFVLWLIWQNIETRQRYHVGNLTSLNGKYTFSYVLSGKRRTLLEAIENGYQPHLAFRNIQKTYVSDRLFDAFSRRLPDKRRPDFNEVLLTLGLSKEYSEMDLLRATGGRLGTDPYEFVAPIIINNGYFDFYIAGWRYYEGENTLQELKLGEKVEFELDLGNPEDNRAVVILTTKYGNKLGFVPAFYSEFMYDVIKNNGELTARIESINIEAKPQQKVNISVSGQSPISDYNGAEFDIIERFQFV
jgi:hypothetical protein